MFSRQYDASPDSLSELARSAASRKCFRFSVGTTFRCVPDRSRQRTALHVFRIGFGNSLANTWFRYSPRFRQPSSARHLVQKFTRLRFSSMYFSLLNSQGLPAARPMLLLAYRSSWPTASKCRTSSPPDVVSKINHLWDYNLLTCFRETRPHNMLKRQRTSYIILKRI